MNAVMDAARVAPRGMGAQSGDQSTSGTFPMASLSDAGPRPEAQRGDGIDFGRIRFDRKLIHSGALVIVSWN